MINRNRIKDKMKKYKKRLKNYLGEKYFLKIDVEKDCLAYRTTGSPCSCSTCGNPRRIDGEKTLQEIKSEIDFKQQLKEYSKGE